MALVYDPDFNIMQQSHGLLAIAKLLVESNLYSAARWPAGLSFKAGINTPQRGIDETLMAGM